MNLIDEYNKVMLERENQARLASIETEKAPDICEYDSVAVAHCTRSLLHEIADDLSLLSEPEIYTAVIQAIEQYRYSSAHIPQESVV